MLSSSQRASAASSPRSATLPQSRSGVSSTGRVRDHTSASSPHPRRLPAGHYPPRVTGKQYSFAFNRTRRQAQASLPADSNVPSSLKSSASNLASKSPPASPSSVRPHFSLESDLSSSPLSRRFLLNDTAAKIASRNAQYENDNMVYLEGHGTTLYSCAHCRTHLTSHHDIISKSFHGRHGRAFLFDSCVNVVLGPAEDRVLITGLHSVCDIHCKRCDHLVGWTYQRAYEHSQKYKEGKFIVEKIHLHEERDDDYDDEYDNYDHTKGSMSRRKQMRSSSWGSWRDGSLGGSHDSGSGNIDNHKMVYEYSPMEKDLRK